MLKAGPARTPWIVFWVSMIAYAVVLLGSQRAIESHAFSHPVVVVLALLPVIPILGVAGASIASYHALDELQRRIQSEGLMCGFVLTAVVTLGYGFLEGVDAVPKFPTFAVWPLLATGWLGGSLLAKRRYR